MQFLRLFNVALLTLLVMFTSQNACAKIIKWVDEHNVTHYGDKLPPQYAGHNNTELSERGTVIKQNKPVINQVEVQANLDKQEQEKKDKALLASYSSVQEIDAARDRNLQLDLATMQTLAQQQKTVETRGAGYLKISESLTKQKKPLPANLVADMNAYKADLIKVQTQITDRKASMEQTKQRYALEKARFIVLKTNVVTQPNTLTN